MPPRKQPFPPERDTQPDMRRPSGRSPKSKRDPSQPPTVPPPKSKRAKPSDARNSAVRTKRPPGKRDRSGATVDEVVADMSRDPRRERDD